MRFGVVGCGLIGRKRAQSISTQGFDIVGFADVALSRAEALSREFGGGSFSNVTELLDAGCDALVIATDHGSLAPTAIAALQRGVAVLVEKPAGKTLADVEAIKGANSMNRPVSVGFNHRFHPSFLKIRELVSSGAFGELMFVRGRYGHGGRLGYENEWRSQKARSGGGELIDQGAHLIDLSMWYLGDMALDYAHVPTLYWGIDVEDNCFLALKGADKTFAWLHASWTEWKNTFSFEISGRAMKVEVSGLGGSYGVERMAIYKMLPEMGPPETLIEEFPFPDRSWDLEIKNFAAAIRGESALIGDIDDAIRMHRVIDQAYSSANLQK